MCHELYIFIDVESIENARKVFYFLIFEVLKVSLMCVKANLYGGRFIMKIRKIWLEIRCQCVCLILS